MKVVLERTSEALPSASFERLVRKAIRAKSERLLLVVLNLEFLKQDFLCILHDNEEHWNHE